MSLKDLAADLGALHARIARRGGEIVEYRVKRAVGPRGKPERFIDTASRAVEQLRGHKIPADAWLSCRIELTPDQDARSNYKVMQGRHYVPSNAFKAQSKAAYAAAVMRLADMIEKTQGGDSVVIRVATPPPGFMAVHGDGLLGGDRIELVQSRVKPLPPKRRVGAKAPRKRAKPAPRRKAPRKVR